MSSSEKADVPRWRRVAVRAGLASSLVVACTAAWLLSAPYADLRTDLIKQKGLDPALAVRGRQLLLSVARSHGLDAWQKHHSFEVTAIDSWPSGSP
jgi:hypothetical protein